MRRGAVGGARRRDYKIRSGGETPDDKNITRKRVSLSLFDLTGRTALVTGSSRGIGLAIAGGLARAGARVIINGRNAEAVQKAVDELRKAGLQAEARVFDVSDPKAVETAIDAIEREIAPLDILVNNAGKQHRSMVVDFPDEAWHDLIRTNVDSVFFMSRAVGRRMIPRKRGKIINIGSVQSELGRATISPYTATKGAVKMLTKGLCAEWAQHGIQVNAIGPGYFDTELTKTLVENKEFTDWLCRRTPAGRWGKVDELIGAAIFLASDASGFVNGHLLMVDGGLTSIV